MKTHKRCCSQLKRQRGLKKKKDFQGRMKYNGGDNKPRLQENLCQVVMNRFLFLSLSSASLDETTHKYFPSDKRHFCALHPSLVLLYQVSSYSSGQFYQHLKSSKPLNQITITVIIISIAQEHVLKTHIKNALIHFQLKSFQPKELGTSVLEISHL